MTCYSLCIKARFCPEVLERILRVIRHRGFELNTLNMSSHNKFDNKKINIFLTVSSNRAIFLLSAQLNKLTDIYHIEIQ
ncbi:acetolactate synthase 2 small subunit [Candidatus Blochmannia vicinus (nom. nud.)]|uniref:Acetolactate synthase 2 small subunit n=1 Tax=Candidatus Blochmannia vicinus (nom. nud.) TaxID=251540 RepID=A0A9Q8TVX4_9ENTR|nr:acetolactate synthase 2 small subunit [Candidatus Blochmannia vicinus]URJ28197.1 acetolactate synthase 2 small subunit [Candidatus Blochmannia vicinus]URJ30526.1 acetolactate synthase 2 small subunit [Candidatus Blochmannia vicinus]